MKVGLFYFADRQRSAAHSLFNTFMLSVTNVTL